MNIPELPTDNLYKFMATFGFLIAVLSFGYLAITVSSQSEMIAKIEVTSTAFATIADIERTTFERRTRALSEVVDRANAETTQMRSLAEAGEAFPSKAAFEKVEETSAALELDLEHLLQDFEELSIANQERILPLNQDVAAMRAQLDHWRWLSLVLVAAGFGGTYLSYWGFTLWYRRVQIYQDAILARQSEEWNRRRRLGAQRPAL